MVRSDKFTIGLNEAKFGLVAPFFLMDSFTNVIGQREADFGLLNGKLYSVKEAEAIKLIDKVVDTREEAVAHCCDIIRTMNKTIPQAFYWTKLSTRHVALERFNRERSADVENFVNHVLSDALQTNLGNYLASLAKKPGK